MSEYTGISEFITKQDRELSECSPNCLHLNPWNVQQIIYKIIQTFMLTNNPKDMGYTFEQKYALKKEESQIDLEIAFNYKADTASKRPAVFVARSNADIKYPTMRNTLGVNYKESEEFKLALITLPITVSVVASPVGFVEQLADYVKQPLMYFAQHIQEDFGFSKFRLVSIATPKLYLEAKDNFVVELALQVEYNDNWVVRGDHLKLKTFSAAIFDSVVKKPLEFQ